MSRRPRISDPPRKRRKTRRRPRSLDAREGTYRKRNGFKRLRD